MPFIIPDRLAVTLSRASPATGENNVDNSIRFNLSQLETIGLWALKILFALAFLAAASFKLSGAPKVVAEFDTIGFGQWFRYFAGTCELLGAILLLVPRTTGIGAILLTCVSIGAFLTQLFVLHGDEIHTLVFIAAMGSVAWISREQVLHDLGTGSR